MIALPLGVHSAKPLREHAPTGPGEQRPPKGRRAAAAPPPFSPSRQKLLRAGPPAGSRSAARPPAASHCPGAQTRCLPGAVVRAAWWRRRGEGPARPPGLRLQSRAEVAPSGASRPPRAALRQNGLQRALWEYSGRLGEDVS